MQYEYDEGTARLDTPPLLSSCHSLHSIISKLVSFFQKMPGSLPVRLGVYCF